MADSGVAYYCYTHDQGCLVKGNEIPKKLNYACDSEGKVHNCDWEDVGSFKKDTTGEIIVSLVAEIEKENWNEKWWGENVYDVTMKEISN